jgi:hypothetical protein
MYPRMAGTSPWLADKERRCFFAPRVDKLANHDDDTTIEHDSESFALGSIDTDFDSIGFHELCDNGLFGFLSSTETVLLIDDFDEILRLDLLVLILSDNEVVEANKPFGNLRHGK